MIRFPCKYQPTTFSNMVSKWCEMDFVHPQYFQETEKGSSFLFAPKRWNRSPRRCSLCLLCVRLRQKRRKKQTASPFPEKHHVQAFTKKWPNTRPLSTSMGRASPKAPNRQLQPACFDSVAQASRSSRSFSSSAVLRLVFFFLQKFSTCGSNGKST